MITTEQPTAIAPTKPKRRLEAIALDLLIVISKPESVEWKEDHSAICKELVECLAYHGSVSAVVLEEAVRHCTLA